MSVFSYSYRYLACDESCNLNLMLFISFTFFLCFGGGGGAIPLFIFMCALNLCSSNGQCLN